MNSAFVSTGKPTLLLIYFLMLGGTSMSDSDMFSLAKLSRIAALTGDGIGKKVKSTSI